MTTSALQKATSKAKQKSWKDRFQQVASQPDLTEELANLVELLKLPLSCTLAVHQVLREGNWKTAEYPRAYVKKASITQARKMHLSIPLEETQARKMYPNNPSVDDTLECGDSRLVFVGGKEVMDGGPTVEGIKAALVKQGGILTKIPISPMKGKHYSLAQLDLEGESRAEEKMIAESKPVLPDDFWIERKLFVRENGQLIPVGTSYERDWSKWAREAGLDPVQLKVIEYRRLGVSRDAALSEQPDEASRKSLQAAWKRFDRTGKAKLKEFVKKCSPSVPDEQFQDTKDIGSTTPAQSSSRRKHPVSEFESQRALRAIFERTGGKTREDLGRFLNRYRAALYGRGPTQFASAHLVKIIDSECPE